VHDVTIELGGLKPDPAGRLQLVKEATGRWNEDAWQVSVLMRRDGGPVASAELVYRPAGRLAGRSRTRLALGIQGTNPTQLRT
jgi:hypothetical protein